MKYVCQRNKCESAALADLIFTEGGKHRGNDDKTGEESDQGIHCADQSCISGNIFIPGEIRPVRDHDGHTDGQRVEGLAQRRKECAEIDLAPVQRNHILKTLFSSVQSDRTSKQDQQQDEQSGHTDLIEPLNAAFNAPDNDDGI